MKRKPHPIQCCIKRAKTFINKPIKEQIFYIEAALRLSFSRLSIQIIPFRFIADQLGTHMAESTYEIEPEVSDILFLSSRCISTLSPLCPFDCKCLVQAITAKKLLDRRRIKSTLYIGVKKDEHNNIRAHAWVRSGKKIVTGDGTIDQFTVISTFS